MTGKDAIKHVVEFCHMVTRSYVDDLADKDLMVRAVPGGNHIAWQLGHLITSDHQMMTELGCTPPVLPQGFAEAHTKETASSDDATKFFTKRQYIDLMDQMKAAGFAAITATTDTALDEPAPEAMRSYAPTKGAVLSMLGTHWLMHAGQFALVRRKLGKPPLF